LCELGVRAFSGSRDAPQDAKKAEDFFNYAAEIAKEKDELLEVNYF
jgi:hypothetical protein